MSELGFLVESTFQIASPCLCEGKLHRLYASYSLDGWSEQASECLMSLVSGHSFFLKSLLYSFISLSLFVKFVFCLLSVSVSVSVSNLL